MPAARPRPRPDGATLNLLPADAGVGRRDVFGALRTLARAATDGTAGDRAAVARTVTATAIASYWSAVTAPVDGGPAHGLAPCAVSCDAPLRDGVAGDAAAFGALLAAEPQTVAAYALGTLYTLALPDETRTTLGAYYTPPPVAGRLLDLAEATGVDWTRARVVDPAAGGGAFVVPAAVRMARALDASGAAPAEVLRTVNRRLRGLELDPFSAWMTRVFLDVALWPLCVAAGSPGRPRRLRPLVRVCDALDAPEAWDAAATLVVGNPPYGKVPVTPRLRARFGRSMYGHANLYGLFFDLAVRLAARGGVVAYVAPASFLGGQYFTNLRALLAAEAPPDAVEFIADRTGVFEDVLQETVLVTLRRREVAAARASRLTVRAGFARVTDVWAPAEVSDAGTVPLPPRPAAPWLLPRTPVDADLLHHVAELPHRLADYGYRVSTGPLVWNRHRAQLTREPGTAGARPLVWAEAVGTDGAFRFTATRRNHVPFVRVGEGQDHLVTREPCVLVQRTTAKEQERRLVAAVLPAAFVAAHGGVVIENHVNVVRNGMPTAAGCAGAATLDAVAALLNTPTADRVFRCISGSVAVSAYELAEVPLPAPEAMRDFSALVASGAGTVERDAFIAAAYGLTVAAGGTALTAA